MELAIDGIFKGDLNYRREYSRRYYHLKRSTREFTARLKTKYGVTALEFSAMWLACAGKCQCCGRVVLPQGAGHPKQDVANIDHCHATGKVRGILCNHCNQALGMLQDKPQLAVAYLEQANARA